MAPPVSAGGAVVFWVVSSAPPYHVPLLADAVRDLAAGGRRAVDATLGGAAPALGAPARAGAGGSPRAGGAARGGGGPAGFLAAGGGEAPGMDRVPAAVVAARARLGHSSGQFPPPAYGPVTEVGGGGHDGGG